MVRHPQQYRPAVDPWPSESSFRAPQGISYSPQSTTAPQPGESEDPKTLDAQPMFKSPSAMSSTTLKVEDRDDLPEDAPHPKAGSSRPHESLDAHRTTIRKLYVRENRTLDDVIDIMRREYGVQAS